MRKLRVTLRQQKDQIQGQIELPADMLFTLECLALVVEQFAKQADLPVTEAAADLLTLVQAKAGA